MKTKQLTIEFDEPVKKRKRIKYKKVTYENEVMIIRNSKTHRFKQL